jgi:hypothetical protein
MPPEIALRVKHALKILLNGTGLPASRGIIPEITAEEVAEAKTIFPLEKFFIFGHARSGTTLLARLVRLHPEVHCNYQAHFFTRQPLLEGLVARPEIEGWLARRSNRWNRGKDLSPVVLRAVADFILERDARREGKNIVGDKSPNSLLDGQAVVQMQKVYPDARLVFIVRDGRDTAISHRFQTFIDAEKFLTVEDRRIREAFATDPEPFMNGRRSVFTEKAIREAAQGWVHNLVETDREGQERYAERYHAIRYEDLLRTPWEEMLQLWAFLGVRASSPDLQDVVAGEMQSNPDAEWQQQKASEIVSPLQKGKYGSWRELFTARDREIFKSIAGQALIDWHYETNMDW